MSEDNKNRPQSPIIIPSSETTDILPADSLDGKLKLDEATLQMLGVKSEADLGDDIELERSPIDGACVVSAKKDGMPVCWYCFLPFAHGIPELEPAEIQVGRPDGSSQGLRVKVHGHCQLTKMREILSRR